MRSDIDEATGSSPDSRASGSPRDDSSFTFAGGLYKLIDYNLSPKSVQKPHPEILQGGNSDDARKNGAEASDWYSIDNVEARAEKIGRTVKFAANELIVVRDMVEEAI